MPKGIKGFQKGVTTNPRGRPKGSREYRSQYTYNLFHNNPVFFEEAWKVFMAKVLEGQPLALGKWCDIFLTRPKIEVETTENPHQEIIDRVSTFSPDKLRAAVHAIDDLFKENEEDQETSPVNSGE